jgi:hypothetical protein
MNEEEEEEEEETHQPENMEEEGEHEGAAAPLAECLEAVLEEEQPELEERSRPATRHSRRAGGGGESFAMLPYSGRPI